METNPPFPCQVTVRWSAVDGAYEAQVPELKHCLAFGDTSSHAVEEVLIAAELWLESAEKTKTGMIEVLHFHFATLYGGMRKQVEEVCQQKGLPLKLVDIGAREVDDLAIEHQVRSFPLTKVYRHGRLLGETSVVFPAGGFPKWLDEILQNADVPAEDTETAPKVFASATLTDEMLMGDTPRCFIDAALPEPQTEQNFNSYVAWLAEHLFHTDLPVPPRHAWVLEKMDKAVSPEAAIGSLGMGAGYFDEGSSSLCSAIHRGLSYRECMAEKLADWQEYDDFDPATLHSYMVNPDLYARLEAEEAERRNLGVTSDNADIPYRPFLAHALKKITDPEGRGKAIRGFFAYYNDAASQ